MDSIPDSGYWIPDFVRGTWILGSNRNWDSRFLWAVYISGSIKPWFADSPANFPRVRIPQAKISRNPESGFPYMGRMCSSYLLKVGVINFEIKLFLFFLEIAFNSNYI